MYLISYDIENDRLRAKAAKLLLQYGLHRVQFSVFMGTLEGKGEKTLKAALQALALEKAWTLSDSFLVLPLHQHTLKQMEVIGAWPTRWEEISGNLNTLIL